MNERFEQIGFNKDSKVTVVFDSVEAVNLVNVIAENIEELKKQTSLGAMCKILLLQNAGQKIVDQIVPKEQQVEFLAETLLKAMQEEEKKEQS